MNWIEGGRRVARATAVVYWIGAVLTAGLMATNKGEYYQLHGVDVPMTDGSQCYYEVRATNFEDARAAVDKALVRYDTIGCGEPYSRVFLDRTLPFRPGAALAEAAKTLGIALLIYLALMWTLRGLRWTIMGFAERPRTPAA